MPDKQLTNLLLEYSDDIIWMIDSNFSLVYANQTFQNVTKQVTGKKIKIGETVFTKDTSYEEIEKWKAYYERGLNGEHFEVVDHFNNPETNDTQYIQVTFKPIINEDQKVDKIACQSRDITSVIKSNLEAEILLDASLDVICSIDEQGNFTKVNAACKALWGYEKHELIGKAYIDFVIEEDVEKTNLVAADIIAGKSYTTFENRYKRKDGGIAFNLWSARWDPKAQMMFCVARDGREKIRKEELLIESENRFKALVQEGADMISIIDAAGNYIYTSPNTTAILGIAPEEFKGNSVLDLIHPDDIERAVQYLQRISTETKVIVEPFRFKDGNNEWRWLETVLTNMLANPAVNGIVVNSRDITNKIEEQHRLKLLESVITNTNDAVLITEAEPFDEPGPRILYVNEAFTKMTGYTAEEVIGKTPRILQGPNSDYKEIARLSKAIRNWEPCEITTINYKKSGEEFWINFSLTPVADETGWYTHWISIERDVTEQKTKELENELVAQISSTFNLENDFEKATKNLCEIIGLYGKLDWVELWTPNLEMTKMRAISHYVKSPEDEVFYTENYNHSYFQKDEGLIGKVWASGKQILWDDETLRKEFIRKISAEKIGLKSVLGIPLIFNNEVLGVLSVGVKSNSDHIKNYTRTFEQLEKFIGSELQRKTLETELGLLFDTIPDIISVGDFQGRFLRMNKPGCELLGYNEEEILQKGFENLIHPEDLNFCYEEIQKLQNGHDSFGFEVRFITKSGEIIWLSWYCKAKVKEGLIYCSAKNITEEKKLRELNRQANNLAKIGSWEYDLIKDNLFWSLEVYHLHGMDPGTFVPNVENAIDFYKEEHKSYVADEIHKSLTEGVYLDYEAVIITRSKKEKWVRVIGTPEFIDGKCVKFIGYFQDTTEHREAEIRLESIADNLPGVVFQYIIYPDGIDKLLNVSDGAELVWGFSAEEAMENNQQIWTQLEKGGDLEAHKKSIEVSIETKSLWKNKYKYVMPNNEIRTHLGNGSPTFLADGTIVFNSVILDITEETKNEELLKQAYNIARIGSWEVDVINGSLFWSDITHEIHETSENFKPQLSEAINFYREDFRELVTEAVNACIETGTPFDFEAIIVTNKKNEVWVRSMGKAQMLDGKCVRIFGSFQDINTLKLAELNQLKLIEEKSKVLESIGDAFFAVDKEWTITYWNRSAESVLGKKKEDVVGENLWNEFADAIDTDFYTKYHYAIETMETQSFEAFYETTNQWIEVTAYPSQDGLSVYFRDITERKKSESEIKQANERFEKVTEATNDVIWDWDIDGDTFLRSKAIDNFFGAGTPKVMEKKDFWQDNFHKEDLSKIKSSLQKALEDPECNRWEEEYRILSTNNEIFFVIDRGLILRNKNGEAIRMVGAMTNITEQKKQEEKLIELNQSLNVQASELKRSNQELEQFAFVSSHDLQEPLRMITSFMDLLKRNYGDQLDSKANQYIYLATDGAERMKQIILDLLLYSRANKPSQELEEVDLNETLSDFKELRKKVIVEKSVVIHSDQLPIMKTHKAPITQVFHGILDNAIKYAKQDISPIILIQVKEKQDAWEFSVKDNGIGIDNEFFEKIFGIFQRLHNREQYEGTGIGLAVVKRSVEFLGGTIWVTSKVGEGSTFYFTIKKQQVISEKYEK